MESMRKYDQHQQQQHLIDLQQEEDTSAFGDDDISRTLSSLSAAAAASSGNVDRVIYHDLVEMLPLVQSLIDRKPNPSFSRRGSMVYTKTPSRDTLIKKAARKSAATLPAKKQRDAGDKNASNNQDGAADFSMFSSSFLSEKDREELEALRNQVADLKRQLEEKDELLKSAELSKTEMASICTEFDQLKNEALEKDSLIKSIQLQLSDLKVKLADKQAAVEKLQWEAMTSNKKVEILQGDLDTVQREMSSFMVLVEGLTRNDYAISANGDYDDVFYPLDENHELDYEMDAQKLEAAQEAYIEAVLAAKEKQDEGSIADAATARFRLQSMLLKQT